MSKEMERRQAGASPSVFAWQSTADIVQLEVDDLDNETEESLIARGAAYTREVVRIENASTVLKKNAAVVLIAIRKRLGDWRGESYEYRERVNEMYRMAGVPNTPRGDDLKASVRYHVGNGLRRYLTPRELRHLGLKAESPLERQQDTRATAAAIVRATKTVAQAELPPARASEGKKPSGQAKRRPKGEVDVSTVAAASVSQQIKASADQLRLMEVAAGLVGHLSLSTIDLNMTDGQRAKLDEHLAAIESKVRSVRRHLKKRSSGA
ncbi:hypothetical protein ABZ352_35460 [Streptomyces griseofuscus]|uniref:hypothetical protein n=1 Tax=Streptomyces griseofuscus TaxID=146922 RepID=UPI003407106C